MRRVRIAAAGFVLAAGFYIVLIDTVDVPELYAGAGVAVLAAAVFGVSREQGLAAAQLDPGWLAGAWRVLVRVPTQIALVSCEALVQVFAPKRSRGVFRVVPFDAGGQSPRDSGRRALSEALGSLTPNTIVIGIDPERGLLLVHQRHRQGGREELDVMRLG
jgi:multisubunit Na+/H+ antiporter MnhE subunit